MEIRIQFGAIYSEEETYFRVYSPTKNDIKLRIYDDPNTPFGEEYLMYKRYDGIHEVVLEGDLDGKFYHYIVDGDALTDPYSHGSAVNSKRSAIVNMSKTNPPGWKDHDIPANNADDAILYELHVKDFTYDKSSGVYPDHRGKYLGLALRGTKYKDFSTGLDHLVELGVTHIHLLPVFDFITVNEEISKFHDPSNYNWGYDPELYNVPEGSYATDPYDPKSRIKELKTMIMAIHEAGLSVVMDVVYNHTYFGQRSNFEKLVPGYYYRKNNGYFCNGSGVGSEFKSENTMARKFILDSIRFWMTEYKIDGFRFDLMALTDRETMDMVRELSLDINPNSIIYGEPWIGGLSCLPEEDRMTKGAQQGMEIAVFNDDFRNAIKGSNLGFSQGYINGLVDKKIAVETGIVGSIDFDQTHKGFAKEPYESINYVNSHDDMILADKIKKVAQPKDEEYLKDLNKLAFSIIFFSFGIPFIHEGNEFIRTKDGINNTYNQPIDINKVNWSCKEKYLDVFNYFKDLIEFRKELGFFSSYGAEEIKEKVKFLDTGKSAIIAYTVEDEGGNYYLFCHNPSKTQKLDLDNMIIPYDYEIKMVFGKNSYVKEDFKQIKEIEIEDVTSEVYFIQQIDN